MNEIDNPHRKSELLMKLMRWKYLEVDGDTTRYNLVNKEGHPLAGSSGLPSHNLYQSEWMNLAWKCHLWARWESPKEIRYKYTLWVNSGVYFQEDFQEILLDKIRELAIEDGLVQLQ